MLSFFFSTVQEDFHLAKRLVSQINNFYPEATILSISDGLIDNFHELKSLHQNTILVEGECLKYCGSIGLFTIRNFQSILSFTNTENIIKLDPDSFLKRRFNYLPEEDWSGEINAKTFTWGYSSWCRGGGYLIKRKAIEKIINSKLLLHSRYNVLQSFEIKSGKIYEDCRLGHVANELGIYPNHWEEVNCGRYSKRDKRSLKKALVHPIKDKI